MSILNYTPNPITRSSTTVCQNSGFGFQRLKLILISILVLTGILLSYNSEAADAKTYRFINATGQKASDLHVTFTGTGGNLVSTVVVNPPGCPVPAIPSNGTVTNTMVIDWGVDCVPRGGSVTVTVATINGPLAFNSGFWTNLKRQDEPGAGRIDPKQDVKEIDHSKPRDGSGQDRPCDILIILIVILVILLIICFYKKIRRPDNDGDDGNQGEPSVFDDVILELISKRDLLIKVKANKTAAQKANIDNAVEKLNQAIDGLKKMRDGDPTAPQEGDIERAIRDAASSVDLANPGGRNLTLRRLRECLIDIANNLF